MWKRSAVVGVIMSLALTAVAGCAGGGEQVIKIGEIAALTGPTALSGLQEQKGAQMAVDELNAKGGINGKKLQLITYDFKGKVEDGVAAYKRLVQQDKVAAVVGTNFSNVNIAMSPVADQLEVPVVSNAIDPRATTPKAGEVYKYSFLAQPSSIAWGKMMAKVALDTLKAKRAAVLVNNGLAYATSQADPFKEYFQSHGGQIVADENFAAGTTDFKALLTKIKTASPDVILVPQYAQEAGLAAVQARELGITATILGPNTFGAQDYTSVAGRAAEGVHFVNNVDLTDASFGDFLKRYEEKYKEPVKTVNVLFGYDNVMIIADAIKRAGSADPKKIRDALEQTKDVAILQGDGKFTINAKIHRPHNMPVTVFKWQGGKAVPLGKVSVNEGD